KDFDSKLDELRKSRFRLAAEMCSAELRLVTLFEELVLLKDFEEQDEQLSEAFAKCRREKADIARMMIFAQGKMEDKKKALLDNRSKEEEVRSKFNKQFVEFKGQESPYYSKMVKILEHTVKIKSDEESEGDDESSVSTIDPDNLNEDQLGKPPDEEDEYDGSLPQGCDQQLYDDVKKLAEENRPNVEEKAYLERSIRDLTEKTLALSTRMRKAEEALRASDAKVIQAQRQKQQRLNQLSVVVALHAHQIEFMQQIPVNQTDYGTDLPQSKIYGKKNQLQANEQQQIQELKTDKSDKSNKQEEQHNESESEEVNEDVTWALRSDFTDATVCTTGQLNKLFKNIEDAHSEKLKNIDILKERKGELKNQKINLREMRKELQSKQDELRGVQLLMFGQVVDHDNLFKWSASRSTEELRVAVAKEEKQLQQEYVDEADKLVGYRQRLADLTRRNTAELKQLEEGLAEQHEIEKALTMSMSKITADFPSLQPSHKGVTDKMRLEKTLQRQNAEIEALRQEIFVLRRKGGVWHQ
ncbi:MAG: hypothetical protein EZS28_012290, partial [Streblomastix strix]